MNKQRRTFLLVTTVSSIGLTAFGSNAFAQKPNPIVEESDPQAKALGYVADAAKIDKKKSPNYIGGSQCGNCQLYQGKPKEASGACPLYPNKQVSAKAWCNTWVKKAA